MYVAGDEGNGAEKSLFAGWPEIKSDPDESQSFKVSLLLLFI